MDQTAKIPRLVGGAPIKRKGGHGGWGWVGFPAAGKGLADQLPGDKPFGVDCPMAGSMNGHMRSW